MRQILKSLTKMTAGYGLVQWLGPMLSFFFTPILTRILTPSDYGIADYILTVISAISTLSLFALPQALITHFNDKPTQVEWQRQVTGSALLLVVLIGLPISLLFVYLSPQIVELSLKDQSYTIYFQLIGSTIIFGLINTVLITASQSALRARWGGVFSITTLLMTVIGNVVFIIVLRLGVLGLLLVPVANGIALFFVSVFVVCPLIGKPSKAIMQTLFKSGFILLPTVVGVWMLQVVDRLILVHYVSADSMGYYAIANKIAGLLAVIMGPIYAAWTPLVLAIRQSPDAKRQFVKLSRYLIALVLGASLVLGLFSREILIILTRPAYLPAAPYIGLLTYVYIFSAIGTILATEAIAEKNLKELSGSLFFGVAVNVILNFLLIPRYGVWGATIATVVSYAISQIILYFITQKYFSLPYPTSRIIGAIGIHSCILIVGLVLPYQSLLFSIIVKTSLFTLLLASLVLLGVISTQELKYGWLVIQSRYIFLNRRK